MNYYYMTRLPPKEYMKYACVENATHIAKHPGERISLAFEKQLFVRNIFNKWIATQPVVVTNETMNGTRQICFECEAFQNRL